VASARPQALREVAGRPQCGGPLRLLAGPERIESGWWDAANLMRSAMCVATTSSPFPMRAEWLWIFRSQAGWFLHGVFA
jgi:protein ImuB